MNHALRCSHCRAPFVPNPRVKAQRFCSQKPCQRARKTQWQRDKLARDPDYRANQRDCQHHWQRHHPHYWRQYRHKRADYANAIAYVNDNGTKSVAWGCLQRWTRWHP